MSPERDLCYCKAVTGAPQKIDVSATALFLDVDGTLLDIRDNPSEVLADSELIETLEACFHILGGAMSLVSGRSIAEVDRIFSPSVFPVAGAHGAELRFDGGRMMNVASEPLPDSVMSALEALAGSNDGLLLEKKRGGASLHYRKAPQLEAKCRRLVMALMAELGDTYRLIAGKKVFEIAPAAHNKGAAIRTFLTEPPFAGRAPVFIGDDVTDEDGFLAVNPVAGTSIRVGNNEPSEAQYRLPNVQSVREWLHTAILADHSDLTTGEHRT